MLFRSSLHRILGLAGRPVLLALGAGLLAAATARAATPPTPPALLLLLGPGRLAAATPPTPPAVALAAPPAAPLSLEFIQNKGQWPAATRLLAPLPGGGKLVLENQGLAYVLTDAAALARYARHHGEAAETAAPEPAETSRSFRQHGNFEGKRAAVGLGHNGPQR